MLQDFIENVAVQEEVEEWLNELAVYNELDVHNAKCIWISQWQQVVDKEYRRLRAQKKEDLERGLFLKMNVLAQYDDVEVGDDKQSAAILSKSTAEEMAEQITLIDYGLFSSIEPREWTNQRWAHIRSMKELAPNITSLVQQFNNFIIFIQIQILKESSLKNRALALKRIIKMGEHFRMTRNYNSLCAVFTALSSAPIHRLKLCWHR